MPNDDDRSVEPIAWASERLPARRQATDELAAQWLFEGLRVAVCQHLEPQSALQFDAAWQARVDPSRGLAIPALTQNH